MLVQVFMNMIIIGCMFIFYRKILIVVFWQWVNQFFNVIVNYFNCSGDIFIIVRQLGIVYVSVIIGVVVMVLGFKFFIKYLFFLVGRFVFFVVVVVVNCINIFLMRQRELQVGILVVDEVGQRFGYLVIVVKQGIFQVVILRICMVIFVMVILLLIMDILEKKDFLKCCFWLGVFLQVGLVGFCLVFVIFLCCVLFFQKSFIYISNLELELRVQIYE